MGEYLTNRGKVAFRGSEVVWRVIQRLLQQDWDMPTWSGIIQGLESGKAGERPIVDDGDLVAVQPPVKARYEQTR